ncbi:MAG: amino acid adenylation domain-containing protein [Rothia mucilaginosa]|uniref:amino acid adenylation domain-containing protein n=1 Tax=Rothia mucilaginosa TaxID=43675 RepID=UPI001DBC9447|nr:amino acid adenylation domain-containing protein [Rothia mucilaginosa]MBS6434157.1 amino acid adenylation domain-containing protein [Rothia mucilaginosa]
MGVADTTASTSHTAQAAPNGQTKNPWLPLTTNARGIYFAAAIDPENPCYNTAEVLQCPADIDVTLLREALVQLYRENEGFRVRTRIADGAASQQILPLEAFLSGIDLLVDGAELEEGELNGSVEAGEEPSSALSESALSDSVLPAPVRAWAQRLLAQPLTTDEGVTVRSALARYGGFLWVYHSFSHVVADGFAAFNGLSRVAAIYRALSAGQPVPPTRRMSLQQLLDADEAASATRDEDLAFWQASGALEQEDTSLAGRTASPSARAVRRSFSIDPQAQQALLDAAKHYGVSWPVLATAAVGSYLARVGGYPQASFGVPQMNRMFARTLPEATRALGAASAQTGCTAVNVLPVQVAATGPIAQSLHSVKEQYARNAEHPLARQEDLERIARHAQSRLFGAQINVVPFDAVLPLAAPSRGESGAAVPTARIHNISAGPVADATFTLRGMPGRGNSISCEIDMNPALYTAEELEHHAARLSEWLPAYAAQAQREGASLNNLGLATEAELATLRELTAPARTEHPLEYKTLLGRFREAVAAHPQALAVLDSAPAPGEVLTPESERAYAFDRALTYAELDERARALAAQLLDWGVRPSDAVGLRVHRGVEQYVALYALLYAGATYVPVLPDLPAERVGVMMEDAECSLLLHGPGLHPLSAEELNPQDPARHVNLPQHTLPLLSTDDPTRAPAAEELPGIKTGLDEDAYVLFTSGSTGRPKGVAISHRSIDNRLRWQQHQIPVGEGDRVLHKTPISFDVHVWELYWPLAEGAAVVIAAPDGHRDPAYLARVIAEQSVTAVHFVPTMLSALTSSPAARRILTEAGFGHDREQPLRYVVCSGEALQKDQVQAAGEVLGVYPLNLYGPTEAAVDVTFWETSSDPQRESVPIGEPVWNTGTLILDPTGHPVPVGVTGELHLSGVQLARGYKNNPQATAAAFVEQAPAGALALLNGESQRLYRTGDLACWEILPDGRAVIGYRGRTDYQIKVRGQRLELGDIEMALAAVEGVTASVALLYHGLREPALAAVLEVGDVPAERAEQLVEAAREHCAQVLPDYMVPTLWHTLPALPVSPSGKADRKLLASLDLTPEASDAEGPHGLLEQQLCSIIAGVLGRERFGVDEDFFASGGHSLAALEVIAAVEEQLGLRVSIGALFAHPTVQALAASIAGERGEGAEFAPVLPLREHVVTQREQPVAPDTTEASAPLFILPPAGGLGWCYAGYLSHLPAQQGVYALQAEAFSDPQAGFASSLQELAEGYLKLIERTLAGRSLPRRFALMGWSVGGTAAVQVAALAQAAGAQVERVILLDAYPSEQWQGVPAPDEQESFRALLRMGGLPEPAADEQLDLPGTLERLQRAGSAMGYLPEEKLGVCLGSMRASAALMRGAEQAFFDGDVLLVGVSHEDQPYLDAAGWSAHASSFHVVLLEGTHPDLVNPARLAEVTGHFAG